MVAPAIRKVYPCGMDPNVHDAAVKTAAFDWLEVQCAIHGDLLPRTVLAEGFEFQRHWVPLVYTELAMEKSRWVEQQESRFWL